MNKAEKILNDILIKNETTTPSTEIIFEAMKEIAWQKECHRFNWPIDKREGIVYDLFIQWWEDQP